jgi:glycosyltransferase involved in cell wall biosynthesis
MNFNHAATYDQKPAVCFTLWFRNHNNPRYAELFPYLTPVIDFRKVTLSHRRYVRALQFRLWKSLRHRLIYPVVARYFSHRYPTVFTVDVYQIPAWPQTQRVIVDMDDPIFSPTEVEILKLPQVKAIVVTTEKAKTIYRQQGITCPIHVVPQGVSVAHTNSNKLARVGTALRNEDDIVVGYHAPFLTLSADGPRRPRKGQDDLDFLFAAAEKARKRERRIKLWLFGETSESVKRHAASRTDWIKPFGYVPLENILGYLGDVDIGVYPRTWSPPPGRFSVKIAQFMASGIPVVSTSLDESFILSEAACGMVCASQEDFARALIELAQYKEKRAALGEAGRRYAEANLDWSVLVPHYRKILAGVANGS